MIDARELRIGNSLLYGNNHDPKENLIVIVKTIGETGINGHYIESEDHISEGIEYRPYFDEYKFEDLYPIQLTPEILEKWCGFTRMDECTFTYDEHFEIKYYLNDMYPFFFIAHTGNRQEDISILSVSQLQNLYWCLCHQELNVQL